MIRHIPDLLKKFKFIHPEMIIRGNLVSSYGVIGSKSNLVELDFVTSFSLIETSNCALKKELINQINLSLQFIVKLVEITL